MLVIGNPKRCMLRKVATVGMQFKIGLEALLRVLDRRNCNYIWCIKPNEHRQSRLFEFPYVQHQLQCHG